MTLHMQLILDRGRILHASTIAGGSTGREYHFGDPQFTDAPMDWLLDPVTRHPDVDRRAGPIRRGP